MEDLILRSKAKENEAVLAMIEWARDEIKSIDNSLLWSENIDRNRLLDKKSFFFWILDRFGNPDKELKTIEEELDENIQYVKDNF